MEEIKLFEQRSVRSHYDEEQEKWYFSIIDVIAVLTDKVQSFHEWLVHLPPLKFCQPYCSSWYRQAVFFW